jgi:hypothetical protein
VNAATRLGNEIALVLNVWNNFHAAWEGLAAERSGSDPHRSDLIREGA